MPKISVIVPVYNVEKYLRRCIDSILGQTFTDFELILVDDGSSDNGPAICDEYAAKDDRVWVLHHSVNKGAAAARNAGIDCARGRWILFCDADDCYNQDLLSEYLAGLLTQREDKRVLHCFDFRNVWPGGRIENERHYRKDELFFSTDEELVKFLSSPIAHSSAGYSIWNKLYSKEIVDQYHVRFLERDVLGNKDDWAEDLGFNLQYYMCIDTVKVDELPIYLLTKHGNDDKQTEAGLEDRIDHMLQLLSQVKATDSYRFRGEQEFWKIGIWHLNRYLYLYAATFGVEQLRDKCLQSRNIQVWNEWSTCALDNWKSIRQAWDKDNETDYYNMLQYLRTGKMIRYKIKSYILWRAFPGLKKLIRK